MFGTLIFISSDKDAEHIQYMIENDTSFVEDSTLEMVGPFQFMLEEPGFLYRVRFAEDQWLDVVSMGATLEAAGVEADIIHAVSDDDYVDVVSTSGYYDQFTEDGPERAAVFERFGFDIDDDVEILEYED